MSDAHGVARDQLRAFIERIERLEEEKKTIADDIKDVYGEAKGMGYIPAMIKKVIALRKKDDQERMEEELILDTYLAALGMIPQIELFEEDEAPAARTRPAMAKALPRQAADAVSETNPRLIKQVVDGMQTEAGHAALIAAVDIKIEREETEDQASHGEKAVRPTSAGHVGEDSPAANPVANVEEGATSTTAAASNDPASRTDDVRERQHASTVGFADDCRTGGNEQMAAAAAPVGDAAAYAEGIPVAISTASDQPPTGGSHVDDQGNAATDQAGPSSFSVERPATPGVIVEADPPMPMKRSEFVHCFPELSKTEYEELQNDIAQTGLVVVPILRKGDTILDGWARYNIARSLGIEYPVEEYHGSDVLLDVIGLQRAARDFTPAQERKIAAELAKETPHRADDIFAAFQIEHEGEPA